MMKIIDYINKYNEDPMEWTGSVLSDPDKYHDMNHYCYRKYKSVDGWFLN